MDIKAAMQEVAMASVEEDIEEERGAALWPATIFERFRRGLEPHWRAIAREAETLLQKAPFTYAFSRECVVGYMSVIA